MTDSLQRTVHLIETRTGLAVGSLLRADVAHIIARLSGGDLDGWRRQLERSSEESEMWQALLAAFTIGETYFMRDPQHFKLLRETILPALILNRRQTGQLQLDVLSVACSTGEEPYSMAIVMNELLPDIAHWTINLYGLDINAAALAQAQRAVYRTWSFRHVNDTFLRRYFVPHEEAYALRQEIVEQVTFVRGNLTNPLPLPSFDIIFCRNVLLYFTARHVQIAEDNLYRALKPEGWLVLGSAEALRHRRERWQISPLTDAPFYQKTHRQPTPPLRQVTIPDPSQPLPIAAPAPVDVGDAVAALRAGDFDHAEQLMGQRLQEAPNDARASTLLAFIFANRKAYPEARVQLENALRADPTLSDAHYLRAVIFNEQLEASQAERSLQAALYYHRDHLPSLLMWGLLLLQRGDLPRAHKIWERARTYAADRPVDDLLSDVSEMSVGQMLGMLAAQLDG